MRTFKDNEGREWQIVLNLSVAAQLKREINLDVLALIAGSADDAEENTTRFFARLEEDVVTCIDALYILCRKQCHQRNITDEDFGAALAGDSHYESVIAMQRAIADFMPRQALRVTLHKMLDKATEYLAKADAMGAENLDLLEMAAQKQIEKLGGSYTALRAELASTLEDSPSES